MLKEFMSKFPKNPLTSHSGIDGQKVASPGHTADGSNPAPVYR